MEQTANRRFFAFNRLYWMVWNSLPTLEQKQTFMAAIVSFGLDHIEPDFENDPVLKSAWANVLPDLSFSWNQHEQGRNGAHVKQAKSVSVQGETLPQAKVPFPPFGMPNDPPAEPEAIQCANAFGWEMLAQSPKPLTRAQINWINEQLDVFGLTVAKELNDEIRAKGLEPFWTEETTSGKAVFNVLWERWQRRARFFDAWMNCAFPIVAGMIHKLSYLEYCRACYRYGRTNVLLKLDQMNKSKRLNPNSFVGKMLNTFIERSINTAPGNKFHLPSYNDDQTEIVEKCGENYDDCFRFSHCVPQNQEAINEMNSGATESF